MPKNFFQDMVKVKREEREQARAPTPVFTPPEAVAPPPPPMNIERKVESASIDTKFASVYDVVDGGESGGDLRRPRSKHVLWLVALASFVFLVFAISIVFAGAKVTVNPKVQ